MKNPASRYVMAGVFISKGAGGVRVAVNGAGPCVFRQAEMEKALAANWSADALAGVKQAADRPQQRHPRQRRIPRASGGRHGQARARRRRLKA